MIRNAALFVIGAAILLAELYPADLTRPLVVVLALVLMGVVTFDSVKTWMGGRIPDGTIRRPDGSPAMSPDDLQRPQERPAPPSPGRRPPDDSPST